MKSAISLFAAVVMIVTLVNGQNKPYLSKESKQAYQSRMQWFAEAKYGMFIHFGLYSQLGGIWKGDTIKGVGEWIENGAHIPPKQYDKLMQSFNPVNFDAEFIASTAEKAGMKYIVITTKHHDGFCLWDSKYTDFDLANTPFKRDILAELSAACHRHGLKFGTYYSIVDWHYSSLAPGVARKCRSNTKWWMVYMSPKRKKEYLTYMKNQLKELIDKYNTDLIWFDGDWAGWWDQKSGIELYNYIRSLKPSIIINNRVFKRTSTNLDYATPEQVHYNKAPDYKWESCYTLNNTWGFKYGDDNWKQPKVVYDMLKDINKNGGNLLLNIGPDGSGKVPEKSVEILLKVGEMLRSPGQ